MHIYLSIVGPLGVSVHRTACLPCWRRGQARAQPCGWAWGPAEPPGLLWEVWVGEWGQSGKSIWLIVERSCHFSEMDIAYRLEIKGVVSPNRLKLNIRAWGHTCLTMAKGGRKSMCFLAAGATAKSLGAPRPASGCRDGRRGDLYMSRVLPTVILFWLPSCLFQSLVTCSFS